MMKPFETHSLLGFMVNEAARLPCLIPNHRRDIWLDSTDNIDGWSVGHYMAGDTVLRTQPGSVQKDVCLSDLVDDEGTTHLVAHASLTNSLALDFGDIQPFRWQRWLFAFNGTFDLEERQRAEMLEAIPPFLLRNRKGRLDGEILFLEFIAQLYRGRLLDNLTDPNKLAITVISGHDRAQ